MTLTICFAASVALAVPAAPMARTLTNPDGTTIQARQWGDEWYHGWETLDGYTIVKDELGFWCYAEPDVERGLVPSSVRANGIPLKTVPQQVRPPREFLDRIDEMRQAAVGELRVDRGPSVGHFPVFLITFSDRQPTYTQGNFDNLLFGDSPDPAVVSGPGTMKNFYEDVSFGQYSVQGVVGGWYAAANPHDYYGENHPQYGVDLHAASLVAEAVQAADAAGFDWAPYDSDGDGYVDVVAVVHQGTGEEEMADPYDIWSHSWNLTSASYFLGEPGPIQTHDGKIVDRYIIMPELLGVSGRDDFAGMAAVGVFCHEYGHAIGLPDLYDTDYSSEGIGNWGLMGGGSWNRVNRPGDSPAYMTAWSRIRKGWLSPEVIHEAVQLSIPDVESQPQVFQLQEGPEHFLLENRQSIGFDAGLPGHGLLIWHIDNSMTSNDMDTHRMVDLEEADGQDDLDKTREQGGNRGDDGDPYPGSSGNRQFTSDSYPNSLLYDGTRSGVFVTEITQRPDGVVTVRAGNGSPIIAASATPSWGTPPLTVTFSAQVSDPDNDLQDVWWEMPDETTVDGIEAQTTFTEPGVYTATLHAVDNAGNSASQRVSVVAAQQGSVLFVDDDEGQLDDQENGYETYFSTAFAAAGIPYVMATTPVSIAADVPYVIVWNCNDGYPTLTSEDQAFLKAYLDGGGRLLLSGQDILYEIALDSTFDEEYLHVASRNDDVGTDYVNGVAGDPITGGLWIDLDYPFADWSDNIDPADDAVGIFTNDKGRFAALRHEGKYKVIFLAFPFEAIPSPIELPGSGAKQAGDNIRAQILERAMGWFNNRAPHIDLVTPAQEDVLAKTQLVTWTAGDDDNDVSELSVALYYSCDNGATWQQVVDGLPAAGRYEWDTSRVPRVGRCLVRALVRDPWDSRATDEASVKTASLTGMLSLGPNPASRSVNIYHEPVDGTVFVYDIAGRLVAEHAASSGEWLWVWDLTAADGRALANGLYLVIFVAEDGTRSQVERLIVQRK
ncbi:MAG: M6 family metalloprotease domain-containing protein [Bacillota bacterium]